MSYDSYDGPDVAPTPEPTKAVPFLGGMLSKVNGLWQKVTKQERDTYDGIIEVDHIEQVEKLMFDEGIKDTHEIVLPLANQLQIDIDHEELPRRFTDSLNILLKAMDGPIAVTRYRSRHGRLHVVIDLPHELSALERVAWQAALGSDGIREAMGLCALRRNVKNGTLLIHRKDGGDVIDTVTLEPAGRKFR